MVQRDVRSERDADNRWETGAPTNFASNPLARKIDEAAIAAEMEAEANPPEEGPPEHPRVPDQLPVVLRPANRKDLNLITDSWNQNARDHVRHYRGVPRELLRHFHDKQVAAILTRPSVRTLVLCNEKYPEDHVVAYGVYEMVEGPCLVWHFMYVKYKFRKMGFARSLVRHVTAMEKPAATMFSYMNTTMHILKNKEKLPDVQDWIYNPFLATQSL